MSLMHSSIVPIILGLLVDPFVSKGQVIVETNRKSSDSVEMRIGLSSKDGFAFCYRIFQKDPGDLEYELVLGDKVISRKVVHESESIDILSRKSLSEFSSEVFDMPSSSNPEDGNCRFSLSICRGSTTIRLDRESTDPAPYLRFIRSPTLKRILAKISENEPKAYRLYDFTGEPNRAVLRRKGE